MTHLITSAWEANYDIGSYKQRRWATQPGQLTSTRCCLSSFLFGSFPNTNLIVFMYIKRNTGQYFQLACVAQRKPVFLKRQKSLK